jgi:hypothetical protein
MAAIQSLYGTKALLSSTSVRLLRISTKNFSAAELWYQGAKAAAVLGFSSFKCAPPTLKFTLLLVFLLVLNAMLLISLT